MNLRYINDYTIINECIQKENFIKQYAKINNQYILGSLLHILNTIPPQEREPAWFIDVSIPSANNPLPSGFEAGNLLFYITNEILPPAQQYLLQQYVHPGIFLHCKMSLQEMKEKIKRGMKCGNIKLRPSPYIYVSDTEFKVILLLSLGVSVHRCAKFMNITIKRVSAHKRNAMCKLNLHSNQQLFQFIRMLITLIHPGRYQYLFGYAMKYM